VGNLFTFQLTSLVVPQAVATVLCLLAAGFVGSLRRESSAALWLLIVLCGAILWSFAGALEFSAVTLEGKRFWTQVSYIGIVTGPVALFHFSYAFTHGGALPPRFATCSVILFGVLVLGSAATNQLHHLHWPAIRLIERDGLVFAHYDRGPMFWATVAYCYGFMLASSVMLAAHTLSLGSIFKQQAWIIIVATLAPWLTSIAYVMRLGPRPELDHTPVGFALTGILLSWAVVRMRLFELVPVAADTLFRHIPDPVLVIDPAGRLVRANVAAIQRFPSVQTRIGQSFSTGLAEHSELVAAIHESGREPGARTLLIDHEWWTLESSPLDTSGGKSRGRLILLRDITEQKYAELALLQAKEDLEQAVARSGALAREAMAASSAKSTFLAQVSHDLRTPLHAIIGMSEVLRAGSLDSTQQTQVATIGDAGDTLLRLINDLLDLSRIEAGRIDLAHEPFQLDDVLDPIADLLSPAAQRKGVMFAHWVEPGLPGGLRGDIDRLRQALLNLVGNAVKFTERGSIVVCASREGALLRIAISDTGPGISPGLLDGLFTPFNRGDAETARHIEGTGLGLAITRRLAEAMNGSVRVSSIVGQGTVFTLELPIADDTATSPAVTRLITQLAGRRVAVDLADPVRREAAIKGLRSLGVTAFAPTDRSNTTQATALVIEAAQLDTPFSRAWIDADRIVLPLAAPDAKPSATTVPLRRRSLASMLLPPTGTTETPFAFSTAPRRRVLLADDNALSRRVSAAQLAQCNCDVQCVDGGLPALERLAVEAFDVIVLDGQMPDLNGWEVAVRLRQGAKDSPNLRTPIIALTADLTPDSQTRWLQSGADILLGKPVLTRELAASLERFMPKPA
jgi:signal transduction histidine kinase/CheY-like chemotaxis protein